MSSRVWVIVMLALLPAGAALAESAAPPPPGTCLTRAETLPAGTALPANVPAIWFRLPTHYNSYGATPDAGGPFDLAGTAIELREEGGAAPVPIVMEKIGAGANLLIHPLGNGDQYLIKPQRPLREGAVVLSYLDGCGQFYGSPPVSPPVRKEVKYRVIPAVTPPARTGTTRVRELMVVEGSSCRDRRLFVEITLEPALIAFPLVSIEARSPGRTPLAGGVQPPLGGRVTAVLFASCAAVPPNGYLPAGRSTVTFHASVAGGPAIAEPAVLEIDLDCTADAGVCEDSPPPDAAQVPDARPMASEVAPPTPGSDARAGDPPIDGASSTGPDTSGPAPGHGGGCDCAISGSGASAAPWLLLLGLAFVRVRRRR